MPSHARLPFGAALVAVLISACVLVNPGQAFAGVASADLSVAKAHSLQPVAGAHVSYLIQVTNDGPDAADDVSWSDLLPGPTTFFSLTAPAGWSCSTPAVGSGGTVSCSIASMPVGSAIFTLAAAIPADTPVNTAFTNTVTVSSTTSDPDSDDLTAMDPTTVRAEAHLGAHKTSAPDPVTPGTDLTYTITVQNLGISYAADVVLDDLLPPGTTFVSLAAPAGWSCTTPAVGTHGTMVCSIASLPLGSYVFTLVVHVGAGVSPGTSLLNRGNITMSTTPAVPFATTFSNSTAVGGFVADISLTKTDAPDPVNAGGNITYTLTANNAGPSDAGTTTLSDTLPAGTTFVSLSSPPGWSCVTPAVGAGGSVSCSHGSFPLGGNAVFTLVAQVNPATAAGTVISNSASLTTAGATDPDPGDTTPTATTTVVSAANVAGFKTASGSTQPGSTITYTVVLSNTGVGAQANNPGDEFTDVLPAGLTLVNATATSGSAVADVPTNTVTWNGAIAAGGSVTITITATINAPLGTTISNQGTVFYDADGNGTNDMSRPTDDPGSGGAGDPTSFVVGAGPIAVIPALDWRGLVALMALLAALGVGLLRRG